MNKTLLGWLQVGMAAFSAASAAGVIPWLTPQFSDALIGIVALLAGGHALTSGAQVQNPPKNS